MKKRRIIGTGLILALALSGCGSKNASENADTANSDSATLLTEVKTTQYFTDEKVTEEDMKKILAAGVNAPSAMNTQPWHFTAVTDEEVTKKLADAMSSMRPPAPKEDMPSEAPNEAAGKPEGAPERPEGAPERPEGAPERPEGAPERPANESKMSEQSGIKLTSASNSKADFSKAPNKADIGDAPLTIVISCEEGSELSAGLAVQNMSAEAQLLGYGTKILTSPTMALNGENQAEYKTLLNIPENQKVVAVLLVGKAASGDENPDALSSATTRNDFDDMVTVIE